MHLDCLLPTASGSSQSFLLRADNWPAIAPRALTLRTTVRSSPSVGRMRPVRTVHPSPRGLAAGPDARLYLYGKAEARKGRKMGHVNRVKPL